MRKAKELRKKLLAGIAAFSLAIGIFAAGIAMNTFVSYAEGQVKVTTPKGANVRKEANSSSEKVGGAENGQTFEVISQVQGSDGLTWYQIQLNATTTGYIRSDLVEYIAPAVAPEGGEPAAPVEVTEVNPVSATVSKEGGKITDNAAAGAQTVADVAVQTVLTVTGQATDAEGAVWYRVSFTSGENQVQGFIRDEFLTLSGELTPVTNEPPVETTPEPPVEEVKDYDTLFHEGDWLLYVRSEDKYYSIKDLFDTAKNNGSAYEESEKTVKTQKIIIIILVFLLVAAVAGIAFLVFKIRDMMDSAYFNQVEKEALRKRKPSDGQGTRKVTHTVGADRQPGRNAGARPAGSGEGTRPMGSGQRTRPAGSTQGARPAGSGQGTRSVGNPQGTRPAGSGQGVRPTGSPQGTRPAGSTQGGRAVGGVQGTRPAGSTQGVRPMGSGQGTRPGGTVHRPSETSQGMGGTQQSARSAQPGQGSPQKAQPKNFMADDDFDFEFLNYDEDGEQ